jgi:hypothetical protein
MRAVVVSCSRREEVLGIDGEADRDAPADAFPLPPAPDALCGDPLPLEPLDGEEVAPSDDSTCDPEPNVQAASSSAAAAAGVHDHRRVAIRTSPVAAAASSPHLLMTPTDDAH